MLLRQGLSSDQVTTEKHIQIRKSYFRNMSDPEICQRNRFGFYVNIIDSAH